MTAKINRVVVEITTYTKIDERRARWLVQEVCHSFINPKLHREIQKLKAKGYNSVMNAELKKRAHDKRKRSLVSPKNKTTDKAKDYLTLMRGETIDE